MSDLQKFLSTETPWLADGGLETDVIFNDGYDLPDFASFHLFEADEGRAALTRYYERYIEVARDAGTGFALDTATWRSGAFWENLHPRGRAGLEEAVRTAVQDAKATRERFASDSLPIVIVGAVGPAGDGYNPEALYSGEEAEAIHAWQIGIMAEEGVDMVTAVTMTHPGEAIGIVKAAQAAGIPVAVSFTVETDGRLPTGQAVADAVAEVESATGAAPVFYMINCAHPDHFSDVLQGDWLERIGGIRANASRMSHAELDEAEELDDGDPQEFGALYGAFADRLPGLKLVGGCCGSDHRHIGCVAHTLFAA